MKVQYPKIGTKMYYVCEHFYHIPGCAAPEIEYCVCEGVVAEFITVGYTEVVLHGTEPDKGQCPSYHKISDIGKLCFYTAKEAALYAKGLTEKYEAASFYRYVNDGRPLRRTWEHLL